MLQSRKLFAIAFVIVPLVPSTFALASLPTPEKPAQERAFPTFNIAAEKKDQTCQKDGSSVKGGTRWCRSGEWHECNGKNGEWVNTRQKCKA